MPRKQAISSCNCCYYSPLPSWKTPRADEDNERLLRYDADARGFSVSSSLVRQDPYPQGQDPAGDDLAQSIAAAILDGQISAELFVDVLPFVYGKKVDKLGFAPLFVAPYAEGYTYRTVTAMSPVFVELSPPTFIPSGTAKYCEYRLGYEGFLPGEDSHLCWDRPLYYYVPFGITAEAPIQGYAEGPAQARRPVWNPGSHSFFNIESEPNTASAIFSNRFWSLGGNVRYSRCNSCRDFWVCRFRLTLGDQERLWMPSGSYASGTEGFSVSGVGPSQTIPLTVASVSALVMTTSSQVASPSAVMPLVKVVASKTDTPDTVLATAYARATPDNDGDRSPQPGEGDLGPLGLLYKPGRSSSASPGYSQDPVAGVSYSPSIGGLDVYRNGELVAKIPNTARTMEFRSAAIEAATTDEGSYLLVGDNTADDCSGPMFVLGSLVVDRTPPIGVVRQMGDIYVGDASGVLPPDKERFDTNGNSDGWVTYATECLEESEPCSGNRNWTQVPGGGGLSSLKFLPVGQYVFRQAGPVFDRAGNNVPHLPELRFNVRALPPSGSQYGAVATLALRDTGRGTFFATSGACCNALLYAEPIESVVVRFSNSVSNLQVSHFKLERRSAFGGWAAEDLELSGERPRRIDVPEMSDQDYAVLTGNVLLTQTSPREYTLTFRQGPRVHSPIVQPLHSVFYLTLDPEFDGSEPIAPADSEGEPDEQQRCRLAARVMWGIMPEAGKNRDRINTQAFSGIIGGVSSVTKAIALMETDPPRVRPNQISVRTTSDIEPLEKRITEVEPCDGNYVPAVPAHSFLAAAGDANYSYFGLGTSIYPSPPATVPACAAPRVAQKHSSAVCSSGTIVGWNASFFTTTGFDQSSITAIQNHIDNAFPENAISVQGLISYYAGAVAPYTSNPLYYQWLGISPGRIPWVTPGPLGTFPDSGTYIAPGIANIGAQLLKTPVPSSLSFGTTLNGHACQQNVWAIDSGGLYQGWLTASRAVQSYPALQTSFLGRLSLGVSGFYAATYQIPGVELNDEVVGAPEFGGWAGGTYLSVKTQTDYNWVPFWVGPYQLTPSQEAGLANGGNAEFVVRSTSFPKNFWGAINRANLAAPQFVSVFMEFPPGPSDDKSAHQYVMDNLTYVERLIVRFTPIFA
jgi:hypothetical protein